MDFPFGHHKHHHQSRGEQEEPPAAAVYGGHHHPPRFANEEEGREGFPPPSDVYHQQHAPGFPTRRSEEYQQQEQQQGDFGFADRPPQSHNFGGVGVGSYDYADAVEVEPRRPYQQRPPPPPSDYSRTPAPPYLSSSSVHVQHVAHETFPRPEPEEGHRRHNPLSFLHHHSGTSGGGLATKPTVRIFSQAEENYSLAIREGKVVLAKADPSDQFQHWIKDEKYSTKVKDEEGFPSFALVNKATGQALKHSIGATHPVQLCPYESDILDESVLWTESKEVGPGFRAVRMVNNIRLNFDAFKGDKKDGGVHDGTILVLWEWKKGENQRWKIVPYCEYSRLNC